MCTQCDQERSNWDFCAELLHLWNGDDNNHLLWVSVQSTWSILGGQHIFTHRHMDLKDQACPVLENRCYLWLSLWTYVDEGLHVREELGFFCKVPHELVGEWLPGSGCCRCGHWNAFTPKKNNICWPFVRTPSRGTGGSFDGEEPSLCALEERTILKFWI